MEQTNIYSACPEIAKVSQIMEEVEFINDASQIGKILCINHSAKIDSMDALQGEAVINGTIFSTLVYLNEVGELKNQLKTNSFNTKIENENITPMSALFAKVEIIDSSIVSATQNEVLNNVTLEITLNHFAQKEIKNLDNINENIKVKTEKCEVYNLKTTNSSNFNVVGEENLKLNANEIFVTSAYTSLKSITAGTGYFTVSGEVNVNFAAQSQDEDKPLKCFTQTFTFKEEIENEQIAKEDIILANIYANLNDIQIEFSQNDGRAQFGITIPQDIKYIVLNKMEVDVVTDAFSTDSETNLNYTQNACCNYLSTKYLDARVDGNFTILDTEPRIAKIVCASPNNLSLTKTFLRDNNLIVEGLIKCCVSYESDDDETYIQSVQTEIPFSCNFKNIDCDENANVFVVSSINNVSAKSKKGKEIDLDIELSLKADIFSNSFVRSVDKLLLGELYTKSEYPLQIYMAPKGSTLWDICKKLKTSEEHILSQNSNLVFPLENPSSIVYFKNK